MDTWEKGIVALAMFLSMGIGVEIGIRYARKQILLWLLDLKLYEAMAAFIDKFYGKGNYS